MKSQAFKTFAALAIMGAMFPENNGTHFKPVDNRPWNNEPEPLTKKGSSKQGHKEFTIDGYTVTALNRKNAIKKVNKLKQSR